MLQAEGVTVLVQSKRFQMFHPGFVKDCGLNPLGYRIIVVKSNIAYRGGYLPIAQKCIELSLPGLNVGRPTDVPLAHCQRPVYPLDDIG